MNKIPENEKNHSPFVEEIPRYIRGCRWFKIHWEVPTEFHEDNRTTRVDSHRWTIANPSYLLHHNFLSTLLFSGTHWERFCTNRFLVCCILCSRQNKQTNNRVSDAFVLENCFLREHVVSRGYSGNGMKELLLRFWHSFQDAEEKNFKEFRMTSSCT